MWNLEQTERFVVWTRPIIICAVLMILLLLTLQVNPVRLSHDLAEPRVGAIQHSLK